MTPAPPAPSVTSTPPSPTPAPAGRPGLRPASPGATLDPHATRIAVLANPYSGTGPNRRRVAALLTALRDAGFEPVEYWTPHERRAALAEPDALRCAVVAGGDGSIADAINEMAEVGPLEDAPPLACFPMGNENLFSDELGFSKDPASLCQTIAEDRWERIDLGQVGDRLFTLMASTGIDAEVVRRMTDWRTLAAAAGGEAEPPVLRRANRLSYGLRMAGALRDYPYTPITVEADGRQVTGAHAFAFNLPRYGGGLKIAPDADPRDGLLDWVVFRRRGWAAVFRYLSMVALGRHREIEGVLHGRAASLTWTTAGRVPVQADGDLAGETPTTVTIRPAALRVLRPA